MITIILMGDKFQRGARFSNGCAYGDYTRPHLKKNNLNRK